MHGSQKRMITPMYDEPSHWWVRVRMRTVYGPEPPLLREPPVAVTFGVDREITYHLWADTTPQQLAAFRQALLGMAEATIIAEGREAGEAPSRTQRHRR